MKCELVQELLVSEKMLRQQYLVFPRFRIKSIDGSEYFISVPLSDDYLIRDQRMRLIGRFIQWKQPTRIIMAGKLDDPESVFAFGLKNNEEWYGMEYVKRQPLSFSDIYWQDKCSMDIVHDVLDIFDGGTDELTEERIAQLERVFGKHGEFEAHRVH